MKIGFFITARLKSSRLKRKILLDLNGKTILDRVIQRAKNLNSIDGVVLCTSTNIQDSELYDYALKNEIEFYAGSENDVLFRLYSAARYFGFDAFLSITADNPLHSTQHSSIIIENVEKEVTDFVFPKGLPLGLVPYYLRTDALDVAVQMKKATDTEIWAPYVNQPDFFNILDINFTSIQFLENSRLTCDYIEDYNFLQRLYTNFTVEHEPSLVEINDLIRQDKSLLKINSLSKQTSLSNESLSLIQTQFDNSILLGKDIIDKNNYKIYPGYREIIV